MDPFFDVLGTILLYVISLLLGVGQFFVAAGICAGGYILLTKILGWFAK